MEWQLDQFKVGDVLRLVGEIEELPIEKVWLSQQGPYRWVDYETRSRRTQRRVVVSVEYDDGEWEASVYDYFPSARELPNVRTLPSTINWDGAAFHREERGRCKIELISHGEPPLDCEYADYFDDDERTLAIEVFGAAEPDEAEVEIFVGRVLRPSDVQLYLPVDTQPRASLITNTSAGGSGATQSGTITVTRRQLVIGCVVLAVIVLFIIMAARA